MLNKIQTDQAPKPQGHYSQAITANGFVFISGILGIKATDKQIVVRTFEQQTQICLENLKEILNSAGSDLNKVLKVTVYIDDINKWDQANKIYSRVFGAHKPARAIVPCKPLHHGFEIEIEATALE